MQSRKKQKKSCCISLLTPVGSLSGDEVLKACPTWACRKQLLAPRIRAGFRPSRDTAFSSFLPPLAFLLFRGQLLLGPQSSVRRRVRLLPFSVGHFLPSSFLLVSCARSSDNSLLRMFSPSLGNVPAFAPVELSLTFPRLLVLRLGLNSPSHNLLRPGVICMRSFLLTWLWRLNM